jgi:hypothetical protein
MTSLLKIHIDAFYNKKIRIIVIECSTEPNIISKQIEFSGFSF